MNERLKTIRKSTSLTQKDFGGSLGVSRDTYASYESGRVVPSDTFIQLLAKTYSVNQSWLTTGQGDMYVQTKKSFINELSERYSVSATAQKIIECYLNLDDARREGLDAFIMSVAESLTNAQGGQVGAAGLSAVDEAVNKITSPAPPRTVEEEADAFADMAREQFLGEKKAESQALSAKESGAV